MRIPSASVRGRTGLPKAAPTYVRSSLRSDQRHDHPLVGRQPKTGREVKLHATARSAAPLISRTARGASLARPRRPCSARQGCHRKLAGGMRWEGVGAANQTPAEGRCEFPMHQPPLLSSEWPGRVRLPATRRERPVWSGPGPIPILRPLIELRYSPPLNHLSYDLRGGIDLLLLGFGKAFSSHRDR